jgi:uncharacterized protein (UPF0305 family)
VSKETIEEFIKKLCDKLKEIKQNEVANHVYKHLNGATTGREFWERLRGILIYIEKDVLIDEEIFYLCEEILTKYSLHKKVPVGLYKQMPPRLGNIIKKEQMD